MKTNLFTSVMKASHLASLLLVVFMVFLVTSCGSDSGTASTSSEQSDSSSQAVSSEDASSNTSSEEASSSAQPAADQVLFSDLPAVIELSDSPEEDYVEMLILSESGLFSRILVTKRFSEVDLHAVGTYTLSNNKAQFVAKTGSAMSTVKEYLSENFEIEFRKQDGKVQYTKGTDWYDVNTGILQVLGTVKSVSDIGGLWVRTAGDTLETLAFFDDYKYTRSLKIGQDHIIEGGDYDVQNGRYISAVQALAGPDGISYVAFSYRTAKLSDDDLQLDSMLFTNGGDLPTAVDASKLAGSWQLAIQDTTWLLTLAANNEFLFKVVDGAGNSLFVDDGNYAVFGNRVSLQFSEERCSGYPDFLQTWLQQQTCPTSFMSTVELRNDYITFTDGLLPPGQFSK
jgi:hypothetical protein